MTAPTPTRFQKAALMLHGLSRRDQAWLLKRLLPAVRSILQPLLNELRGLGIAPGVGADDGSPPPVTCDVVLHKDAVAVVNESHSNHALKVLGRQPERVQAALIGMHDWLWKPTFCDSLSMFQRSALTAVVPNALPLRPLMLDALLQAFATELEAEQASAVQPGVRR